MIGSAVVTLQQRPLLLVLSDVSPSRPSFERHLERNPEIVRLRIRQQWQHRIVFDLVFRRPCE